MDLSIQNKWANIRVKVANDHVTATELADATADPRRAERLRGKAEYTAALIEWIDAADRLNGPQA